MDPGDRVASFAFLTYSAPTGCFSAETPRAKAGFQDTYSAAASAPSVRTSGGKDRARAAISG